MTKNLYLAGKLNSGEVSIDQFADELEQRGHTVIQKWWEQGKLPTPYLDHPRTSGPAAQAMLDAAFDSDITILFPDDKILGAAVELGTALASTKANHAKKVIVVNPHAFRQSVFYAHPAITVAKSIDHVRKMDWF